MGIRYNICKDEINHRDFFLGPHVHFSMELLYNNHTKNFIDIMCFHFFQPNFTEPTRIVGRNKPSLIDNIFINTCTKSLNAGNIIDKISDHLPNFLIIQNLKEGRLKWKIQIRDMKNFKLETFSTDLEKAELIDFPEISNLNEM